MQTAKSEMPTKGNIRMLSVCFLALAISLPIAWISLAKVLVILIGLGFCAAGLVQKHSAKPHFATYFVETVLLSIAAFAISIFWTSIDLDIALLALSKHSKLITAVLMVYLIRTEAEARLALALFFVGQTFLLMSSWLLAAGIPIPWTIDPRGKYVIFSTYLDQSIMFAVTAGVFWHTRHELIWPRWLAHLLAVAAITNVLFLLDGRTGYAVAISVLALAAMWAMPTRLRLITLVLTPLLVLGSLYLGSAQVRERVSLIVNESTNYSKQAETDSSSGWRLNAWQRSIEAIQEAPWHGHGVGSWAITVKRLQGDTGVQTFGAGNASNPHQEYLLWSVELGIAGGLLFITLLLSVVADARHFPPSIRHATLTVAAAIAVACLFNSALYDDLMGDFFCITLGLLLAYGLQKNAHPLTRPIP